MNEISVEEFKQAWIKWKQNGSRIAPKAKEDGPYPIGDIVDEILHGPEFESPIEKKLYGYLESTFLPTVHIEKQFWVNTICGNFRIDFVIDTEIGKIGLECDGREYHVIDRDMWRDAMILAGGDIKIMYRFSGSDIHSNNLFCLHNLIINHPDLFKPGAIQAIVPDFIPSKRRAIARTNCRIYGFGRTFYQFASAKGGGDLDDVMAAYQAEHPA